MPYANEQPRAYPRLADLPAFDPPTIPSAGRAVGGPRCRLYVAPLSVVRAPYRPEYPCGPRPGGDNMPA